MKLYKQRSKVLSIAHALKAKGWSFSDAQKKAWSIVRCIVEMQKSEVVVQFCKENQTTPETRTASLAPTFVTYTSTTTASKPRKKNPLQIFFFDTTKNAFRSFNAERFVGHQPAMPF